MKKCRTVYVRELPVRSSGDVTLWLDRDPFALSGEDREFVFGLIDRIQQYEEEVRRDRGSDGPPCPRIGAAP